ncbi:MAG TPA: hypothetical protein VF989_21335 [Polyangiaceae bacterium]|jgi:hypothetical protein
MTDPRRLLEQELEGDARRALEADGGFEAPSGAETAVWRSLSMLLAGGAVGGAASGATAASTSGASGASAASAAAASASGAAAVGKTGAVASGVGSALSSAPAAGAGLVKATSLLGMVKAAGVGAGIGASVVGVALYQSERSETPPVAMVSASTKGAGADLPSAPRRRASESSEGPSPVEEEPASGVSEVESGGTGSPGTTGSDSVPAPIGGESRQGKPFGVGPPSLEEPVSAESAMVLEARAALRSGNVARSRELLERAASLFPNGALSQEREALYVEALIRNGAGERARRLAESFVERYPSSPHAGRVREIAGLDAESAPDNR